jgi:iron(III) transport system substrate-binding protein
MKKFLALVLAVAMLLGCMAFASAEDRVGADPELVAAAQEDGELVVYGSCEEPYLIAACQHFEELYGIKVSYQRLSTGEVQTKIAEEKGNPSADVWFGGTNDPYNEAAAQGLLMAYEAKNASHLLKPFYRDPEGYWYGIYQGILGFMVNTEELARLNLEAPKCWDDLLKPEYKGLIWLSNPNTAGTAKLVINTMVQMKGHDEAMKYFVELDKNIAQYTKSGSGPSKKVGVGECVIGIGFLHDGVYQILQGYDNIDLLIPEDGTSYEIGSTAIFEGCEHENAAKLWIEYALSPECVELADDAGSYQFLVLDNAEQPAVLADFKSVDPSKTIEYDFADAKANTSKYVQDYFDALGAAADDRFKTE